MKWFKNGGETKKKQIISYQEDLLQLPDHYYNSIMKCVSSQGEVGPPGKPGLEGGLGPLGSVGPRGITVQGKTVGGVWGIN